MNAFTLGVHNLPEVEKALVKTLVRLFSHNAAFAWRFTETGPFDALLVDTTRDDSAQGTHEAQAVLKITRAGTAREMDSISRPIRAEQLQAWLERRSEFLRKEPRRALAGSRPAQTSGHAVRFKLRRWPPAALLKNEPQRIRLATLLSRRALNANELSSLSGLSPAQCLDFLDALREAALLLPQMVTEAASPAVPTTRAPPVASGPRLLGLIAGIRRQLGL